MIDHVDLGVKEEGSNSKKPEGSQDRGMIRSYESLLFIYLLVIILNDPCYENYPMF